MDAIAQRLNAVGDGSFSEPAPRRTVVEGELLWTPSAARAEASQLAQFTRWLEAERGLSFADYTSMWEWSVADSDAFWAAVWDYFRIESATPYTAVSVGEMPRTRWFTGATLNFAEHALRYERRAAAGEVAIVHSSEIRPLAEMTWHELGAAVRTAACWLRSIGIAPGDRIVSYLPNLPETVIAMLATTAVGAIWSSAAPEFGARTVIERFSQTEPKLLFAADGYRFGGNDVDRRAEVRAIAGALPTLERVVWLPYLDGSAVAPTELTVSAWSEVVGGPAVAADEFVYERVASDHPLWVLYTSGTTGLPKAIVHGHVGITVEQLKNTALHQNLGPDSRLFFYSTTGWVVWNALVSALLQGASIVLYDGHPAYPQPDALWAMASRTRATSFGTSPTYVRQMEAAGIVPRERFDLSALEMIFLTGAPATPESFAWLYEKVKSDLWVTSQYGSTDLCTGIAASVSTSPVYAGEIQGRVLGIDVQPWNEAGRPVVDEIGEVVIAAPCPSMPLFFWNDVDDARYRESYFSKYPGVWRQGDFVKINRRGGAYVTGRSDATLNRNGVRIGTAEIYRCVERIESVTDSLAVCLDVPGSISQLLLFVKVRDGRHLDDEIKAAIARRLRDDCSERHVPDEIYAVPDIPYTLSAKRMEIPVLRILQGVSRDLVAAADAMRNPAAMDWFVQFRTEMSHAAVRAGTPLDITAVVGRAWRRTLGARSLSEDAEFEGAGGDSVRLLKFVYHLEVELGRKLPLDIFAQARRPSDFIAALRAYLNDAGQPLQPTAPVFLFPGIGGDDPRFANFRASCRDALNIVLISYPDWTAVIERDSALSVIVARAVAEIVRLAPAGPLRLAGYSFGGYVAYACSVALRASGRSIVSLALFDTPVRPTASEVPLSRGHIVLRMVRDVLEPDTRAMAVAGWIARRITRFRPSLSALKRFRNTTLPFNFNFHLNWCLSHELHKIAAYDWHRNLAVGKPLLEVPLTLFRTNDYPPGEPDDLNWRWLCSDVNVVRVAGTHLSMFERENGAALREAFVTAMNPQPIAEGVPAAV